MAQTKQNTTAQTKQNTTAQTKQNTTAQNDTSRDSASGHNVRNGNSTPEADGRSTDLRESPMMARLLDALEGGQDVGHYGQFTFATIARHFMDEDEVVSLLTKQPDMDEDKARALFVHVSERNYSPPRRERILEQQKHQQFQLIDADDPDSGNIYRELQFPEETYEHINEYYVDKAEHQEHASR